MFRFDNTYARVSPKLFTRQAPTPVCAPQIVRYNEGLARQLGLDPEFLAHPQCALIFSGNLLAEGADPLAMVYGGHQFGVWVPQLGDGRAVLLGEHVSDVDGASRRWDIVLKGSGKTAYSRGGDGRAALGPVVREYVVSEAMHALGITTTRALAMVTTGQTVQREVPLQGAILTRVAASHIRVGTFQWVASTGDEQLLRLLADYVIDRYYPKARDTRQPYVALFEEIVRGQAELIAKWMSIGFIHGVMNTDNMSVSAETIDYGPCAFMDGFRVDKVLSYIDMGGRYAYGNQPKIGHWNLARLAEAMLVLFANTPDDALPIAHDVLQQYSIAYEDAWLAQMGRKIGLASAWREDRDLIHDLLALMHRCEADFTLTFRMLGKLSGQEASGRVEGDNASYVIGEGGDCGYADNCDDCDTKAQCDACRDELFLKLFSDFEGAKKWLVRWRKRIGSQGLGDEERRVLQHSVNPVFIPRNHLVQEAIDAAQQGDFEVLGELQRALSRPFDDQPERRKLMTPPRPEQVVHQTFCGT